MIDVELNAFLSQETLRHWRTTIDIKRPTVSGFSVEEK